MIFIFYFMQKEITIGVNNPYCILNLHFRKKFSDEQVLAFPGIKYRRQYPLRFNRFCGILLHPVCPVSLASGCPEPVLLNRSGLKSCNLFHVLCKANKKGRRNFVL